MRSPLHASTGWTLYQVSTAQPHSLLATASFATAKIARSLRHKIGSATRDARRRIIGALSRALNGYKPDDLRGLENSKQMLSPEYPRIPHTSQRFERLDKPISTQEQTEYSILLAAAREAEPGSSGRETPLYIQASSSPVKQIEAMDDVIVLQSVELISTWYEKAVSKMEAAPRKDWTIADLTRSSRSVVKAIP